MNFHGFNPEISCQTFLLDQQNVTPIPNNNYNEQFASNNNNNISTQIQPSFDECQIVPHNLCNNLPYDLHPLDPTEVPEIPDTCFNYISELLREEYSSSNDHFDDTSNLTLEDYMAAQMSYNKSFDDALHFGENFSFPFSSDIALHHHHHHDHQCPPPDICPSSRYCLDDYLNMFSSTNNNVASTSQYPCYLPDVSVQNSYVDANLPLVEPSCLGVGPIPASLDVTPLEYTINNGNVYYVQGNYSADNLYSEATLLQDSVVGSSEMPINENNGGSCTENSWRKKNDEDNQGNGERSKNKHSAPTNDVIEQIEQFGDVILCPEGRSKPGALCNNSSRTLDSGESSKGSKKRGRNKAQLADLRGLLTRCAQCIAQVDLSNAYELLKQIRENSSPYGDFLQRVAHYLANGLEARLEGRGMELSRVNEQISPCEVLKANRIYVASVPFQIMSYYTMNKTIAKLVEEAPSIHIIDFGIYYGLQWPCIIQNLSKRPNGPPRIRITGVDFPQRGFRPSERVEETGRCLAKYCEKYNVPFEYYPISKKWEDVEVDELKIERNEPLVVNCLYRSHLLFDESVEENSPRDAFLKLVRKINPDLFMHAVVNSTLSVPFFLNRFKEAMFHFSSLFDIFESTMSREDNERKLLESMIYGGQALNIIACEGVERVERPESYKQWQVRTQRAGFEQVGLDRDLLRRARAMVRRSFRQEFSYDEDGYWVVQGWKGRILYAISCWKPS